METATNKEEEEEDEDATGEYQLPAAASSLLVTCDLQQQVVDS